MRVHVHVQVGDVHVRLPDELELVVAKLHELARGLRHGGQLIEGGGARDRVGGLVHVLDFVLHRTIVLRHNALDGRRVRGAPIARILVEELDDFSHLRVDQFLTIRWGQSLAVGRAMAAWVLAVCGAPASHRGSHRRRSSRR